MMFRLWLVLFIMAVVNDILDGVPEQTCYLIFSFLSSYCFKWGGEE